MTTTQEKLRRNPHQATGAWLRPDKRLAIYLRDGFKCLYCDTKFPPRHPDLTVDHIVSRKADGDNDESNLITACRSCNSQRKTTPIQDFASPEAIRRIHRAQDKDLQEYRRLAVQIMAQEKRR